MANYSSREKTLDMIHELRRVSSKCDSSTPAFMRDTVHHLEEANTKKEITKEEYNLLYRDLISIGQQFFECDCTYKKEKPRTRSSPLIFSLSVLEEFGGED